MVCHEVQSRSLWLARGGANKTIRRIQSGQDEPKELFGPLKTLLAYEQRESAERIHTADGL